LITPKASISRVPFTFTAPSMERALFSLIVRPPMVVAFTADALPRAEMSVSIVAQFTTDRFS
jgi:hypothetical protein